MNDPDLRYPLAWPTGRPRTPAHLRQSSKFSNQGKDVTVAVGLKRVKDEISRFTPAGHQWVIRPDSLVISSNLPLNRYGEPKSNPGKIEDPGIAIYFKMRKQDYAMACDKWLTPGENLAAIAKHLESMRGQERWGVGSVEQSFEGYLALPATTTGVAWWRTLELQPDAKREDVKKAYVEFRRQYCDPSGNVVDERWYQVQQAYDWAVQSFGREN